MSTNIDSLNIEISAETSKAEKSINRLIAALERIKGAVSKASSLSAVTKKLAALDGMAKKLAPLETQVAKINALVAALKQLDALNGINIKQFLSTVKKLPEAVSALSETNVNVQKMSDIVASLKAFETLGKNNINPFISSAKKLPEAVSALNSMPDIDSSKIVHVTSTLQTFESLGKTNINPFISSAKKLPEAVSALNGMKNIDIGKLNQVVTALRTFETLGKNNINSFLNSLKKIPTIAAELKTVDFDAFSASIQKAAVAVKPLADEMAKISSGFSSLPTKIQKIIQNNTNLTASNSKLNKSYGVLGTGISAIKVKIIAYGAVLKRISSTFADYFVKSNEYVENINLFTVAMGNAADESMNFAEKVNNLLGIDISEWIRNQGVFKSITSGFGVVADEADLMSKNLTQVAYDIASFYNIDTEEAMTKVQSGISGELEPLRRLGYALDVATLQQVAYNHGIETSVNKMTQAQKTQLRYITIMEQSKNVMGDMARTITSPSNSMRVLNQQFEQLKRAIGNVVSVLVAKLIPYIQAFVRLITEAAEALAKMWGFELPEFDYSGLSVDSLTDGVDDLTDALDDTTDSAKEAKKAMQRLAGFDEINVLRDDTDTSSSSKNASSGVGTGTDLGIELPEYDFLAGLEKSSNEIYERMKKFFTDLGNWVQEKKPLIENLVKTVAALWALGKIVKFWNYLKQLWGWFKGLKVVGVIGGIVKKFISGFKDMKESGKGFFDSIKGGFKNVRSNLTKLQKTAITAITTVISAASGHDLFYKMTKGTLDFKSGLLDVIGAAGSIATAFALTGPVGGVITTLGFVAGAISGVVQAQQEMREEFLNNTFFDGEGVKLDVYKEKLENSLEPIDNYTSRISDMKDAIEESNVKLDDAQTKVDNFRLKLDGTGKLTEGEVEEMKTALGDLVSEMQNNFKLNTDVIFEAFRIASTETAETLGVDVGKMTTILQSFQDTFNTETSRVQASANSYLDKISKGIEVTPEETKEFNNNMSLLSDLNNTISENSVRLQEDMQDVVNGAIDFEDVDSAKEKIEEIGTTAQNTMDGIKDAYITQKTSIENLIKDADTLYDYGKLSDEEYKQIKQSLDDSLALLEANYNEQKKQAQEEIGKVFEAIENSYVQHINELVEMSPELMKELDQIDYMAKIMDWNEEEVAKKKEEAIQEIEGQFSDIKDAISDQVDKFDLNGFSVKYAELGRDAVKEATEEARREMQKQLLPETIEEDIDKSLEWLPGTLEKYSKKYLTEADKISAEAFAQFRDNAKYRGNEIGKNYGLGMNSGVKNELSKLKEVGDSAFTALYDATYKAGLYGSPSKKTYQLGEWYIEGFTDAVNSNSSDAAKSVKLVAEKVNTSFSTAIDFSGVKKDAKKFTDNFVKGLDINNVTASFENMFNTILGKMNIFANNLSSSMNTTLSNMVKSVNSVKVKNGTASVDVKMPTIVVPKLYAGGGYPKQGEMFMARENGAELVGRIGSKTAVANNDQIVEGIKSGVYEAMVSAKGSDNSDNQPLYIYTTVYLDNDEIYNSVDKRSRRELMRSNGRSGVNN